MAREFSAAAAVVAVQTVLCYTLQLRVVGWSEYALLSYPAERYASELSSPSRGRQ